MEFVDVLIVAKPGPLCEALVDLIRSISVQLVPVSAETGLLALKLLRYVQPKLIVMASSLSGEEVLELVRQVKIVTPTTHCLVMAETSQQVAQAHLAGAEVCVLGSISAVELIATIQQMLASLDTDLPNNTQCSTPITHV